MKRLFIIVYSVFVIIMLANYFYYKDLYKKQINYIFELLHQQVRIVGLQVDETNNGFLSDLNQISFPEDPQSELTDFFTNPESYSRAVDRMKLFFTKYEQFVTGMRFYDNSKHEFTLKMDSEDERKEWLAQKSVLHAQADIYPMEKLVRENRKYNYYQPIFDRNSNEAIGNIVVSVDFQKYFREIFTTFNLKDYQWQWVVSDSGQIIYDNYEKKIEYSDLERISGRIAEGSVENTVHSAVIDGKRREIISSYYSTQLLQRELGLVFSAPTAFFQKYIIRNSLFIVVGTLLLIQIIIYIFWKHIKSQKSDKKKLKNSEKLLNRMIEEMPAGFVIYDKNGEVLKTNSLAATEYSCNTGPELTATAGEFLPGQLITVKKDSSEIYLLKKSTPVVYKGQDAMMEILVNVTDLEVSRMEQARANSAKSEFLSRFSYEIRTPLHGIISMTDVLSKYELTSEIKDIIKIMRRSAEVLLGLANNVLDFSKIEAGKMILDEVPFNLKEEVNYSIEFARTNNTSEKLSITCDIDRDVPKNIIGDPFRLRHILSSLLNHSVRNTHQGEVVLKCIPAGSKDGILTIQFEISDTGRSFTEDELKEIFGNTDNAEMKLKRRSGETDFGVVLSKQLIEMMGGKLMAVSPSGLSGDRGTKIVFTINVYSNERIKKILPSLEKVTSFTKLKTLIITGNTRDEEVLSTLHQLGLGVTVTSYMKTTIPQIGSNMNHPDDRYGLIVILDDANFNGFEAASALWENKLSAGFTIMMISSNDKKGNYQKCISTGVDHYLVKPLGLPELKESIKSSFPSISTEAGVPVANMPSNNLKILVVEDNKLNQKVIGTMLGKMGYSFDIAEDGYAAYLQAKARQYDLILMDLLLPEMSGFEASQKILKTDRKVKIIALTADIMPETKKKSELSGIIDFISKPVTTEDLKRIFELHFGK